MNKQITEYLRNLRLNNDKYGMGSGGNTRTCFDPNLEWLWPGSIVDGRDIAGGGSSPSLMGKIQRAPVTMISNIGSTTKTIKVEAPSSSTVKTAISRKILEKMNWSKQSQSWSYRHVTVDSLLELDAQLSVAGSRAGTEFSFDASLSHNQSSKLIVVIAEKIFGAVTLDSTLFSPFTDDASFDEVKNALPESFLPTYVSGVTYGRRGIFITQISHTTTEASFSAAVEGYIEGNVDAEMKTLINRAEVGAKLWGVSSADKFFKGVIIEGDTQMQEFVSAIAEDTGQPAPLEFSINHLDDHQGATLPSGVVTVTPDKIACRVLSYDDPHKNVKVYGILNSYAVVSGHHVGESRWETSGESNTDIFKKYTDTDTWHNLWSSTSEWPIDLNGYTIPNEGSQIVLHADLSDQYDSDDNKSLRDHYFRVELPAGGQAAGHHKTSAADFPEKCNTDKAQIEVIFEYYISYPEPGIKSARN